MLFTADRFRAGNAAAILNAKGHLDQTSKNTKNIATKLFFQRKSLIQVNRKREKAGYSVVWITIAVCVNSKNCVPAPGKQIMFK